MPTPINLQRQTPYRCECGRGELKRERIRRQTYVTRDAARSDIFDYIEMFYNNKRRHSSNNQLSPVKYEERYQQRLLSV